MRRLGLLLLPLLVACGSTPASPEVVPPEPVGAVSVQELPGGVWIDDQGRPARIRHTVTLPSLQDGRSRSIVTTYDYRGWGEPVDVTS